MYNTFSIYLPFSLIQTTIFSWYLLCFFLGTSWYRLSYNHWIIMIGRFSFFPSTVKPLIKLFDLPC